MFTVLTKEGCAWCVRAKELLEAHGLSFREVALASADDLRARLRKSVACVDHVTTFPQVLDDDRLVGGYAQLVDYLEEPLLRPDVRRFTPFPVVHQDMWTMYKRAVSTFWVAEEINLSQDVTEWKTLTPDERHFVKHVLAFFAGADGIVMENLQLNFGAEVQAPEARQFYSYQTFNEAVHAETYGLLIDALIDDPAERESMFGAIEKMPAVAKKAAWATKWLNPTRRFAERLLGFMCVEGILFSGSFCAIFWLKKRGLMPGLGLANQFISRDEGLHQDFGALLFSKLRRRPSQAEAESIVREAVDNEKEFITQAIPCDLVGMNAELMARYVEFVADRLLRSVGYEPAYGSVNPFPWMELISLRSKDNFFERFSSEYQKAGMLTQPSDQVFALDEEF